MRKVGQEFFVRINNSEALRHELPGLGNSSGLESYIVQSLKGATGFLFLMDNGTLDEKKKMERGWSSCYSRGDREESPEETEVCVHSCLRVAGQKTSAVIGVIYFVVGDSFFCLA